MGKLAKRADDYVGERIRLRRTLLGLTQENLASVLKISYQQVQKYETGANRVSAGRLYEIARHLDTDVPFFFEGFDPDAQPRMLEHGGRNRSTIDLVRHFDNVKDSGVRAAIGGLVKSLAERAGHGSMGS